MKTNSQILVIAAFLAMAGSLHCASYELRTHGQITLQAVNRSQLMMDPSIASDLDLDLTDHQPFGNFYYDVKAHDRRVRTSTPFEAERFPIINADDPNLNLDLSISGWVLRGAVREDDLSTSGCRIGSVLSLQLIDCNPQDDPFGNFDRVVNHFYDPVFNRGLSLPSISGERSPDWAVGTFDAFSPTRSNPIRGNHFSIVDARRAMYFALTGRGLDGTTGSKRLTRNAWWATTFRALGDVMHLLQDTAQPQHTRNEIHPGSVLEAYIEARASNKSIQVNGILAHPTPLEWGDYFPPKFSHYSDYWSTATGGSNSAERRAAVLSGLGLADYSNRGFFTQRKNFGSTEYPSPSNNRSDYLVKDETDLIPNMTMRYLKGVVPDYQAGGVPDLPIRMTASSIFTRFSPATYALDRFVYDDQVSLLLPRAVGYSTGLLDYFFRGKIAVSRDRYSSNRYVIKNLSTEDMSGIFALYFDDADGSRKPVPGASWRISIKAGESSDPKTFEIPSALATVNTERQGLILVFNGTLGNEIADFDSGEIGAVLATHVRIRQPGFYVLGVDANQHPVSFKVDASGTHVISQYGAGGGLVSTGEFDPLGTWFNIARVQAHSLGRVYTVKQVDYSTSSASTVVAPSVISVTLPGSAVTSDVSVTFFPNSSPNELAKSVRGLKWFARGESATVGRFEITYPAVGGSLTSLSYQRFHKDDSGAEFISSGFIPLPPLSTTGATRFVNTYQSILSRSSSLDPSVFGSVDEFVLSADGTQLCGLIAETTVSHDETSQTDHPNTSSTGFRSIYCLTLKLGDSPSASLVRRYAAPLGSFHNEEIYGDTSPTSHHDLLTGTLDYSIASSGFIDNRMDRWTLSGSYHVDIAFPGSPNVVTATTTSLQGGRFDATNSSSCYGLIPGGLNPWATGAYYLAPDTGRKLLRALTNSESNSIYYEFSQSIPGQCSQTTVKLKFREFELNDGEFVADASPSGELFVARSDKSLVIHEPGAPVIIPSNVVRLVAAVWM